MKTLPPSRHAAFTLMELFLSVLLVSVLLALIFPIFGLIRTRADSTRCLNNLRYTGMALTQYISSSGGKLVSLYGGGYFNKTWSKVIFEKEFLGTKTSFRCPKGKTTFTLESSTWDWQGYGLNLLAPPGVITNLVNEKNQTDKMYTLMTTSVGEYHKHILLADSSDGTEAENQSFRMFVTSGATGILLRHNGKANIYFLDGHIEALDRGAILNLEPKARVYDSREL